MENLLNAFPDDFFSGGGVAPDLIDELRELGLPDDYLSVIARRNGGAGWVGEHYLILFNAQDLVRFNREYEVHIYAPGIFLFGSTGGGDGFGFDTRLAPYKVVLIPFIGMGLDCAYPVAESFTHLLHRMKNESGSLL